MLAKGYTLIELMVVVAIIGVISAIAFPSYQSYTCDTYIGQAVGDMKVCALGLERFYSNGFTYAVPANDITVICPAVSPSEGTAKFNLSLASSDTTFTITATKVTGSSCGNTMTLDATGTLDDGA